MKISDTRNWNQLPISIWQRCEIGPTIFISNCRHCDKYYLILWSLYRTPLTSFSIVCDIKL